MTDKQLCPEQSELLAQALSNLALCFAPVEEDVWEDASAPFAWNDPLTEAIAFVRGESEGTANDADAQLNALFTPPSFLLKQTFFNEHFVGGLDQAALPIESLYRPWTVLGNAPFGHATGLYGGDCARYMNELAEHMGLNIPVQFAACPDHLSIELDLLAVLIRSNLQREAAVFARERFCWLNAFREKLERCNDAAFYLAAVDLAKSAANELAHQFETQSVSGASDNADALEPIDREETQCQKTL